MKCPCCSGLPYSKCCESFHRGKALPQNALALMRSRFSGYSLEKPDYIMATTHPDNSSYTEDRDTWKQSILAFSRSTEFENLEILEFIDGENIASVTFFAHLKQKGKDASFQEKSMFLKVKNQWLYHSGTILK